MSTKLDLDVSLQSSLQLRYQDTGTLELQITDDAGAIQSIAGSSFMLDILGCDYSPAVSLIAVPGAGNTAASFIITDAFWDGISLRENYCFRIRRQVGSEIKTIVNGEVIIN
jgi:hypothetical protein